MISKEQVGRDIGVVTGRIRRSFRNGRENISDLRTNVADRTHRAARKTDHYVHDHAWMMMAVSAGLAFAAGFLLSRGNQKSIARSIAEAAGDAPGAEKKVNRLNFWEFMHSALPLALFAWKALQASRCVRKGSSAPK
jgi:ElaB/YqjD/DUF883 family membrane-anchored ribosome-binding protein